MKMISAGGSVFFPQRSQSRLISSYNPIAWRGCRSQNISLKVEEESAQRHTERQQGQHGRLRSRFRALTFRKEVCCSLLRALGYLQNSSSAAAAAAAADVSAKLLLLSILQSLIACCVCVCRGEEFGGSGPMYLQAPNCEMPWLSECSLFAKCHCTCKRLILNARWEANTLFV